uniref:ribosomal protein S20 n=1 Tax=Chattonella marina TaxID=90936 RepID=UPI00211411E9|nr:ribosomal protein S20 [Chattonella marina]UTE94810.1 ribosomal protein S20 [Chattonella marina]
MANIKSAQKRVQISERNRIRNRQYKSLVKTYTKKYFSLIESYKENPTGENFTLIVETSNKVYSKIDKALKKKIFHKNTAARKKSQIGRALKQL